MLLGCGLLYLNVIELFALLLSLVLGIVQAGLSILPPPLLRSQLCSELLVLLLSSAQGLAGLDAKVGPDPGLISGIFHLLLDHEYLLEGLHKRAEGYVIKRKKDGLT